MFRRFSMLASVGFVVSVFGITPLQAGLVAHWSLNEGAGGTAGDSSANSNDGAVSGATWVAGISGSALDFNGTSDYVSVPDSDSLDITDAITVSLWLKPDALPSLATLLEKGDPSNYRVYVVGSNMRILTDGAADTGDVYLLDTPVSNFVLGQWQHLAATYDKNAGSAYLYLNGAQVDTGTDTDAMIANAQAFIMGADGQGSDVGNRRWYDGTLDEISIYNQALSAEQIAFLAANPGAVFADSLIGDLNTDGFVGQDDLNIILGAWGQNVSQGDPMAGDPSNDGFVGQDDLNFVLGEWGQGVPPGAFSAVPEPHSWMLLLIGAFALSTRRLRTNRKQ